MNEEALKQYDYAEGLPNYEEIYKMFDGRFYNKPCHLLCIDKYKDHEWECCRAGRWLPLLPGEMEHFQNISIPHFEYEEPDGKENLAGAAKCYALGLCNPDLRPFVCRIHPFFPIVKEAHLVDIGVVHDEGLVCEAVRGSMFPELGALVSVEYFIGYVRVFGELLKYKRIADFYETEGEFVEKKSWLMKLDMLKWYQQGVKAKVDLLQYRAQMAGPPSTYPVETGGCSYNFPR